MSPFGDVYGLVFGWTFGAVIPVPSFLLYVDGLLAAAIEPADRTFAWATLGLGDGVYELRLTRLEDQACNAESLAAVLTLTVDGGGTTPHETLLPPSDVRAWPLAGGMVALRFVALDDDDRYAPAAEYEVAEADDPGAILATAASNTAAFNLTLGPFAHGAEVSLLVRASDGVSGGGGKRGGWVAAPRVVADSQGPIAPTILPSTGCS